MASKKEEPAHKRQKVESKSAKEDEKLEQVFESLQQVQSKLDVMDDALEKELEQLQKKWEEKKKPLLQERNSVIKKIPGFWKQTLLQHDVLVEIIGEEDQKVLDHLEEVLVDEYTEADKLGFRITFKFGDNPYFKTKSLWKEFRYTDEGMKIRASPIEWYPGKDLSKGNDENQSFIAGWFASGDQADADEVADIIKEQIWPNPIPYFNGDASPSDLEDEEDDEEEEEN